MLGLFDTFVSFWQMLFGQVFPSHDCWVKASFFAKNPSFSCANINNCVMFFVPLNKTPACYDQWFNPLRPEKMAYIFAGETLKCTLFNENFYILI